jgi:putative transcriptional regulator
MELEEDGIDISDGETDGGIGESLAGRFIMAMPDSECKIFARSLVLVFEHTEKGAMGLIVNRVSGTSCEDLVEQLQISDMKVPASSVSVYSGGPVEQGRGFVLHGEDYEKESTAKIGSGVSLTATIDVVHDIFRGEGPKDFLLILGYAGWGPLQLDGELQSNVWLHTELDSSLLFETHNDLKWERALGKLGISPESLSCEVGFA